MPPTTRGALRAKDMKRDSDLPHHRRACAIAAASALAVLASLLASRPPRTLELPPHLLNTTARFEADLLDEPTAARLRALLKRLGREGLPSNTQDLKFYTTVHEHIGEAQPVAADGSCADPFLLPNQEGTLCILPGRIDIGRHYILTGGPAGLREPYESLISRVQSFGRYVFSLDEYPEVAALFDAPRFVELARSICPAHKQHLDPFQFNLIVQLPGQTVAAHLDGVYFWGATRFQLPQWLLAAMAFSGRFADRFVDQVQVVAYLHEWGPATRRGGKAGQFLHWATGAAVAESPFPRLGSAVDGSKTVHAAVEYLGSDASPPLPFIDKSVAHRLVYEGVPGDDDLWALRRGDGEGEVVQRYATDDLRSSIVYRARCFADAAEAARFGGNGGPEAQMLTLDGVLATLADELVRRGKARSVEAALAMPRKDFAFAIIDAFVAYPWPSALVPWNYCALPRLVGAKAGAAAAAVVGAVLRPLCASVA